MLEVSVRKQIGGFTLDAEWSAPESVVALFGASGTGKSLTLQCLAGLVTPDAGRLVLDDAVLFDRTRGIDVRPQDRQIGYVFQGYALFPHLTVEQNVGFGLLGWSTMARRDRVRELLETLELVGFAGAKPGHLSGGQQQRVALGRALAPRPSLLLLDEPFSALDPPLRRQMRQDLTNVIRRYAKATVLVTHELADAFQLAQRIVVYDGGRVVQSASRDAIFAIPGSEQVARLLGFRNISRGTVIGLDGETVAIDWAGGPIIAAAPIGTGLELGVGSRVIFSIRPEHIRLVRKDRPGPSDARFNVFHGTILDELDQGNMYSLRLAVERPEKQEVVEIDVSRAVYQLLRLQDDRAWEIVIRPSAVQLVPAVR